MSDKPRFDLPDEFRHSGVTGHMPITTLKGRVVYDRKTHFFTIKDVTRIWEKYLEGLILNPERKQRIGDLLGELRYFWFRFMEKLSQFLKRDLFNRDWDMLEQMEWELRQLKNDVSLELDSIIVEIRSRKIAMLGIAVEGEESG